MQCSCGAMTVSREETKNKEVVTKYEQCPKCGRVCILWRQNQDKILEAKRG